MIGDKPSTLLRLSICVYLIWTNGFFKGLFFNFLFDYLLDVALFYVLGLDKVP